jgi:hypothetical protein
MKLVNKTNPPSKVKNGPIPMAFISGSMTATPLAASKHRVRLPAADAVLVEFG